MFRWLAFGVLLIAFGIGLYALKQPRTKSDTLSFESIKADLTAERFSGSAISSGTVNPSNEFSKELLDESKAIFSRLGNLRAHLSHDDTARKELNELISAPLVLSLARKILTDLDFAKSEFGESQALARIYSIKMLVLESQNGNEGPILETIREKASRLSNKDDVTRGEKQDLEDLILYYLRNQAVSESEEDFTRLLNELNYNPSLRRIFRNAVILAWAKDPDEPGSLRNLLNTF